MRVRLATLETSVSLHRSIRLQRQFTHLVSSYEVHQNGQFKPLQYSFVVRSGLHIDQTRFKDAFAASACLRLLAVGARAHRRMLGPSPRVQRTRFGPDRRRSIRRFEINLEGLGTMQQPLRGRCGSQGVLTT